MSASDGTLSVRPPAVTISNMTGFRRDSDGRSKGGKVRAGRPEGTTTLTGTRAGPDGTGARIDASKASRFQRKSRLGLRLCDRATADTLTPITEASATIARFCSALKNRRPTNTTTRMDLSPDISTEHPQTQCQGTNQHHSQPNRQGGPDRRLTIHVMVVRCNICSTFKPIRVYQGANQ